MQSMVSGRVPEEEQEDEEDDIIKVADHWLEVPAIRSDIAGIAAATSLQLLAYYLAADRGLDVDKPRNLAKSVTVE